MILTNVGETVRDRQYRKLIGEMYEAVDPGVYLQTAHHLTRESPIHSNVVSNSILNISICNA